MNGAAAMVRCLEAEGITRIFGYPGVAIAPFYEEVFASGSIEHVLVRQEQAAGHAASGYARISRKPAVCVTSSGPGAANLITALATAYADSIPVVAITGQVHTHLIGNDAFQEVDIVGITRPCTKHNFLVKDLKRLALTVREAFHLARSGRPGPVLIDFPKDLMTQSTEFVWPEEVRMRSYNPTYRPNLNQLRRGRPSSMGWLSEPSSSFWRGGRHQFRRFQRTARSCARLFHSRNVHSDGTGRVSGGRSSVPWHAGHAWYICGQQGGKQGGSHHCCGCAF